MHKRHNKLKSGEKTRKKAVSYTIPCRRTDTVLSMGQPRLSLKTRAHVLISH